MRLHSLFLQDIRCFERLELEFDASCNWNVLLGDNGTGKSTVLQSLGLLLGRFHSEPLRPSNWVRQGATTGIMRAHLTDGVHEEVRSVEISGATGRPTWSVKMGGYVLTDEAVASVMNHFVAGYGPYRRLGLAVGRDAVLLQESTLPEPEDFVESLFQPRPLPHCESWLQGLDYRLLSDSGEERSLYEKKIEALIALVNSALPRDTGYRVSRVDPKGVYFTTPDGCQVRLSQMSDGYRTMFALAVDILRLTTAADANPGLFQSNGSDEWQVNSPGVILIDEVENHLHPKWQRELGSYLKHSFPRFQFIVSSHSPFIAQSADEGGVFVLTRNPSTRRIEANRSLETLTGWTVEDILSSPAFDLQSALGIEAEQLMNEAAALNSKRVVGMSLTAEETRRLEALVQRLREIVPEPDELPTWFRPTPWEKGGHS